MPHLGGEATLSDHTVCPSKVETGRLLCWEKCRPEDTVIWPARCFEWKWILIFVSCARRQKRALLEKADVVFRALCLERNGNDESARGKLRQVKATGWSMLVKFCGFFATQLRRFFRSRFKRSFVSSKRRCRLEDFSAFCRIRHACLPRQLFFEEYFAW